MRLRPPIGDSETMVEIEVSFTICKPHSCRLGFVTHPCNFFIRGVLCSEVVTPQGNHVS